jgi:eukaryotic-like serine/threonine-protein kinase
LPTDEEWVHGCRALANTPWSCGEVDLELLGRYARYNRNSFGDGGAVSSPVATLKPNDFGLFDMMGNVSEWCHDRADRADALGPVGKDDTRLFRGGAYLSMPQFLGYDSPPLPGEPTKRSTTIGFRPARTLPHVPREK